MKLNELRTHVVRAIDAGVSVELISPPGLGKSEFVAQLVDYLSDRDHLGVGLHRDVPRHADAARPDRLSVQGHA